MNEEVATGSWAFLGAFSVVGGILSLAMYVWYLWSLSKLFPHLGLPSVWGWIPVWNQWQLIQRGGLPGWLVLLGLVPGLGIVVLVVSIIAIHRINTEFGKSAGFTVLGAVLPPLWAMLLANHISDRSYSAPLGQGVARAAAQPGAQAQQPYGQQAYGQAQQPFGQQPYGQAPQPQPQPGPVPAQATQQAPQPYASQGMPAAPQPYAPHAQPAPQPYSPQPYAPEAPQPQPAPQAQPQPAPQAQQPSFRSQIIPPAPQAPAAPVVPPADYGFSRTTEGDYERLAAEGVQQKPAAPLGAAEPLRPFSWPEPQDPTDAFAVPPSDPVVLPDPPAARTSTGTARRRAAEREAAERQAAELAAAEQAAADREAAEEAERQRAAREADERAAAERQAAAREAAEREAAEREAAERTPEPEPAVESTRTGRRAAAGAAAATVTGPATGETDLLAAAAADSGFEEEPEDDRTVVVVRRARWGLELPDGEIVELAGDDVIVGRKPEAQGGAGVLQIADPTRTMSKSHARMRRTGDDWTIEDLDSTNGVSVVDERGEAIQIEPGEEVTATEQLVIGTLEVSLKRME